MPDKEIPTQYGKFVEKYYEPVHNRDNEKLGVNMFLEFDPGERVIDATKIGFTQAVKTTIDRSPQTRTNREKKEKMVSEGVGAGYMIDQNDSSKNPLYATDKKRDKTVEKPRNKLEGYADSPIREVDYSNQDAQLMRDTRSGMIKDRKYAGYGEFGYRYPKSETTDKKHETTDTNDAIFKEKNASIQDTPHFPEITANSSQEFETTVVVADGKQKGLYLGSVSWGWERTSTSDGGFKKKPLEIVSEGAPSEVFFKSAERWNEAKTKGWKKTIDLPMSEGEVVKDQLRFYQKKDDVLTDDFETELPKGTQCRLLYADGEYLYIRILDQSDSFKEGFVPHTENGELTVNESRKFLNESDKK